MQVILEAITFNHDPGSADSDAFGIRNDETGPVETPEWERLFSFNPEDSPAAYACKEVKDQRVTIKARFSCDRPGSRIRIRAIDGRVNPASRRRAVRFVGTLLKPLLRRWWRSNVLGEVSAREVEFLQTETDNLTFDLENVRIKEAGVGIDDIVWRWQFSHDGSSWKELATTTHRIYTVVELPGSPWEPNSDCLNTQRPWIGVLEYACRWAAGSTDLKTAARQITKAINRLGPDFVRYDINGGGPHFTPDSPHSFECEKFLRLLKTGHPQYHGWVNCDDCAAMMCTFANVLGCRFPNSIIVSAKSADLSLRRHQKIGLGWENFDQFGHHTIAWDGIDMHGVSDACLQLDQSENNCTQPIPVLAANLSFAGAKGYRHLLVGEGDECELQNQFIRRILMAVGPLVPGTVKAKQLSSVFVDAFNQLSAVYGLTLLDLHYLRDDLIEIFFQTSTAPSESVFRLDIQMSQSKEASQADLMHQLSRFELPTVKLKEDSGFGDKVFADNSGLVILFSQNRFVCLLRNVGKTFVPLFEVARIIDNLLLGLPNE